ncbi:MAG: metallophosphoesterase family protein [Gaiellaceae bacterium]
MRNREMVRRIEDLDAGEPLRFAIAGDSGAWRDPTADAIFAQLIGQVQQLEPAFFVNLGDFAGPGTRERHERYLELVAPLTIPNICVVGNHDLDDAEGHDAWEELHGPMNYDFACGHTRFVAIHAVMRIGRHDREEPPEAIEGPTLEDLEYLDGALRNASEPNCVVLMHMPPYHDGHYRPHANWGFGRHESEFHTILAEHGVSLVCCAHGLAFDQHVHAGVRFVMSGGGGSGLCSHLRGICTEGDGTPEDRGAIFHSVEISIAADGAISGRVIQAFADPRASRIAFGAA